MVVGEGDEATANKKATPATSSPPRWVLRLVSAGTVAFLTIQVLAAVTKTNVTWPVTGFPMFREKRTSFIRPGITLELADGRRIDIRPSDLNLTEHQFRIYMQDNIVEREGDLRTDWAKHARATAAAWSKMHGDQVVQEIEIYNDEYPFPAGSGMVRHPITMTRPS